MNIEFLKDYAYTSLLDINAPILPLQGAGGLKLRTHLNDLYQWIVWNLELDNTDKISVSGFRIYIHYSCLNGKFHFVIDSRNGQVCNIWCSEGYKGKLNGIYPGIKKSELLNLDKSFYASGDFIFSDDYPGIELEIPPKHSDIYNLNDVPDFTIKNIYIPDIDNRNIETPSNYRYKSILNLSAPILPSEGVGELKLGMHISEITQWVFRNTIMENEDKIVVKANLIYLIYECLESKINFTVDCRNGKINSIWCTSGYQGHFNQIYPGIRRSKLLEIDSSFYISGGKFISDNYPGIALKIPEEYRYNKNKLDSEDFILEEIHIYNKEIGDYHL